MILTTEHVDLEQLAEQKQLLVDYLWNYPDSKMWGIVELLDYIQDELDPP